jgi:hypothetical protein
MLAWIASGPAPEGLSAWRNAVSEPRLKIASATSTKYNAVFNPISTAKIVIPTGRVLIESLLRHRIECEVTFTFYRCELYFTFMSCQV